MPHDDVVAQLGASEVEVAMPQAQLLCRELLAATPRDRNRRRDGRSNDRERAAAHFDVASRELTVSHLGWPRHDFAVDEPHGLDRCAGCGLYRLARRVARVERDLHDTRTIAKVDEDEATQVAHAVHPSAEPNLRPHVAGAQCAGEMA